MSKPNRFDWLFRPPLADADTPLSAEVRFAEALAELPAVERSALALSEIGGLDPNEIAERLGTDAVVVGKLLVRARESVRTSLAVRGRRGLTLLLPLQNWWQTGSAAPAVRAAGVVAAAVVGSTVAIGGAAADAPRATLTSPDRPLARSLARPATGLPVAPHAPIAVATPATLVAATAHAEATTDSRRSVRPGAGLQRDLDAVRQPARSPSRLDPGAVAPGERPRPAPPPPLPNRAAETVAATLPLPPLPQPDPVLPPVAPVPLPLPVEPPPAVAPPKLPPPPPLP